MDWLREYYISIDKVQLFSLTSMTTWETLEKEGKELDIRVGHIKTKQERMMEH